jgi:5-methylcytosine-specific restriction endonuclease McrA
MARLEFSRKAKAIIIARANGQCDACGAVLKPGEGDIDHILPCALGGLPEAANGRLICRVCHKAKTADDIRRIRKADRQRDKHSGAVKPVGKIASRPKEARPATKQALAPRAMFITKDAR